MRWIQIALALAGVALGVLAYRVQIDNLPLTTTRAVDARRSSPPGRSSSPGSSPGGVGPDNRLGPLMVAVCFALLARQFRYSHDDLAFTVFFLIGELGYALVAHVAFAYPSGRVTDRLERAFLCGRVRRRDRVPARDPARSTTGARGSATSIRSRARASSLVAGDGGVVDFLQDAYAVTSRTACSRRRSSSSSCGSCCGRPRVRGGSCGPLLLAAVVAALWAVLDSVLSFCAAPPGYHRTTSSGGRCSR